MVTVKIPFLDLLKVADSGQAFRIRVIDDAHIELVAYGRYLQIAKTAKDTFAFSCNEKEFEDIWKPYLDLGRDYGKIVRSIDKNDEYLMAAAKFGEGIRILKQDIFEINLLEHIMIHLRCNLHYDLLMILIYLLLFVMMNRLEDQVRIFFLLYILKKSHLHRLHILPFRLEYQCNFDHILDLS